MPENVRFNSTSRSSFDPTDETINNVMSTVDKRESSRSSIIDKSGVVSQSEINNLSASVGDSVFNEETGKIETWNGFEWSVSAGELNVSTRLISNRDSNIFADGARGKLDPNGLSGWNFNNDYQGEKINWYYVYNRNQDDLMTLESLTSMYAVVTIYNEREFHFSVYTKRENDGSDYSWYRSRVNYELTTAFDGLAGETVLVYFGEEPTSFEDLKRVELPYDATFSNGLQAKTEDVLFASLSTDSNASALEYSFTAQTLGYVNDGSDTNTITKIGRNFDLIDTEVATLKSFKEAVELGRFFRGFVSDDVKMNELPTPTKFQYVARMDTATIWEYNGTEWYDTLIVASLEGIAQEEELVVLYSNTRYIDLDGLNDYVNVTGVPTDVMGYAKEWSLSIQLAGAVSPINDSTYITLFKRGTNEITLRRGGSNWGLYAWINGYSRASAQANTWYAPNANSSILIISTSTHLKYYLDGVLRANVAWQGAIHLSSQDYSGDLQIGNSEHRANWYGGVNNLMVMEGGSSDLGKDQLAEFNAQDNVSNMSFYPSVTDFLCLGERPYPSVLGMKQVLEGTIENSTESAIAVKNPAGAIGTPFPQRSGRYVFLDGTDNYIEFDNANADVLDFTGGKKWAVGFKCNGVSGIVDYVATTLWRRGDNEITLKRGGSNWGLYVYCDGASIGQANTWYAPQDDSTIVFTFDGTKLRYYIDGALRSTLSINTSHPSHDASGNLFFGSTIKSTHANWYGGAENCFIMNGNSSVLSSHQINEFGSVDGVSLSYYNSLQDYFNIGIDTYPSIDGIKGVVTGDLVNGNAEDFINI